MIINKNNRQTINRLSAHMFIFYKNKSILNGKSHPINVMKQKQRPHRQRTIVAKEHRECRPSGFGRATAMYRLIINCCEEVCVDEWPKSTPKFYVFFFLSSFTMRIVWKEHMEGTNSCHIHSVQYINFLSYSLETKYTDKLSTQLKEQTQNQHATAIKRWRNEEKKV